MRTEYPGRIQRLPPGYPKAAAKSITTAPESALPLRGRAENFAENGKECKTARRSKLSSVKQFR